MPAAGHKGERRVLPIGIHRCDGGDIRQMGAPMEGVIADDRVAREQSRAFAAAHLQQQIRHRIAH